MITRSTDVEQNMGLVYKFAAVFVRRRYEAAVDNPGYEPVADTLEFSDGCEGLMKAEEEFDPERDCQFSTLAVRCIRNSIINGIKHRSCHKYTDLIELFDVDLAEVVDQRRPTYAQAELKELYKTLLSNLGLSKRDMEIFIAFLHGVQQTELAEQYGVSPARIGQIIHMTVIPRIRERHAKLLATIEKDT